MILPTRVSSRAMKNVSMDSDLNDVEEVEEGHTLWRA